MYFNHSQHVSVAGVDCQKCHGPVEEMEILYQYSPLTMGWCIDCHRESNIKVKGQRVLHQSSRRACLKNMELKNYLLLKWVV